MMETLLLLTSLSALAHLFAYWVKNQDNDGLRITPGIDAGACGLDEIIQITYPDTLSVNNGWKWQPASAK